MKFSKLTALGHNLADSFASGMNFMIGHCYTEIFNEASASEAGFIEVNFLNGTTVGSPVSADLLGAVLLYQKDLPAICEKNGVQHAKIKSLVVRFGTDRVYGQHFLVTVESTDGKKSTAHYVGTTGRRLHRARAAQLQFN